MGKLAYIARSGRAANAINTFAATMKHAYVSGIVKHLLLSLFCQTVAPACSHHFFPVMAPNIDIAYAKWFRYNKQICGK
jgi:hypothetical protein